MIVIHHRPFGSYALEDGRRYMSAFDTAYALGYIEPDRRLLPVPKYIVEWFPFGVNSEFSNSIVIHEVRICECCGCYYWVMVAIWDFNYDRCLDFFLVCGEYMNAEQIEVGLEAYRLLSDSDVGIQ